MRRIPVALGKLNHHGGNLAVRAETLLVQTMVSAIFAQCEQRAVDPSAQSTVQLKGEGNLVILLTASAFLPRKMLGM